MKNFVIATAQFDTQSANLMFAFQHARFFSFFLLFSPSFIFLKSSFNKSVFSENTFNQPRYVAEVPGIARLISIFLEHQQGISHIFSETHAVDYLG